jgi:hypothetical protein
MLGQVGVEFYLDMPERRSIEQLLRHMDRTFSQFAKYGFLQFSFSESPKD